MFALSAVNTKGQILMLDFLHLPTGGADIQIFNSPAGFNDWRTWVKPRGKQLISFIIWGAGGGGGGGFTAAAGAQKGGGGGGGAGAIGRMANVPAFMLPDILYIQCGAGGAGSTGSGANGTSGIMLG